MKYVAFIDTLGFKDRISNISHEDAVALLKQFNQSVFNQWSNLKFDRDKSIRGRTFSDSIIIHSLGDSIEDLEKMLKFIISLYRTSITISGLPLRGGLAIGDFDDIEAIEFENLQKGLIVGKAFIEAYLLESSNQIKGSKLLFGQEINLKIERLLNNYKTQKIKTDKEGKNIYELKWADLIFLTERNYEALNKFIDLVSRQFNYET